MSKKYLTPEDRAELDRLTRTSGLKGSAVGLVIGLGAAALTYKRSPHFRSLTKPMQAILPGSAAGAGYLFAADRVAQKFENIKLGYVDEDVIRNIESKSPHEGNLSTKDRTLRFLNDNRWSIIAGSWAVTMVGALSYSFSNRYLTTQQKLVQARMYAQAITVAVLMASAGLSIYVGDDNKNRKEEIDDELRAVLSLPVEENKAVRPAAKMSS
ncbi:hypothetical protein RO3G_16569 [Lichtheimia corymbifera JMRC:FSU:9682]|uniref:HIG1 domain-containing protein n=1 Tax=Lichtheimia corymbifera JMRC:FSU:9682 TaxID=1263082 RepID=A0A068RX41_9FUNG|nr:hypothetical protein RO3G_16569 [Lichtheimia corymbifera JMRC:FSU:9682]